MGLISGFMGGAGAAAAKYGEMSWGAILQKDINEANDLRNKELRTDLQSDRQEFLAADTDKKIAATASEGEKDRASRESVAETKAKADAEGNATSKTKNARDLMNQGYPKDVANAVAQGALKQIKDEETGDMVLINALNNKPVGRLTSGGTGGEKVWLPEGEQTENAPITGEHRKAAEKATSEKAGWMSTDETDFPETGGDRGAWRKKEAQRLANEQRGGAKSGIVNSAVDIDRSTPQTTMPAPKESAPKAALDWLKRNPDKLPQFIEKYGYDPTKS